MNDPRLQMHLTSEDPVLTCIEMAAAVSLAVEEGSSESAVLRAAGITKAELEDSATLVSLRQQYVAFKAAAQSAAAGFSMRMASRLRLTAYGIAGYALLSSSTLADAIRISEGYSPLLNLKFGLSLRCEDGVASVGLHARYAMDPMMLSDSLNFEICKLKVLLEDVACSKLPVIEVACLPAHHARLHASLRSFIGSRITSCALLADGALAELRFDARALATPLPQAHAGTHRSCSKVCDALMQEFASRYDLEQHVRSILRKSAGRPPALPEIASKLCMSQRTLRRRLEALNTSYNQILCDVRRELAISYVTQTRYTTEVIAELLGYSEAANFRHAFKRWTGKSPRNYGGAQACEEHSDESQVRDTTNARCELRIPQIPRMKGYEQSLHAEVAAWR